MFTVGIMGITGYAGIQLMQLIASHPHARLVYAGSHSHAGKMLGGIYPQISPPYSGIVLQEDDLKAASAQCDVLFLALPAGIASQTITKKILDKTVIIDLGADFRLHEGAVYEAWYKKPAASPELLSSAVYGLAELHRHDIATSRLVANPGCYTTCSILSLAPLIQHRLIEPASIIIDAKSGVSGAGRSVGLDTLYCEVNESVKAYGVGTHRHTPEIEQELGIIQQGPLQVQFTPHLVPMDRGILATCYATLKAGVNACAVEAAYRKEYDSETFIKLCGPADLPQTRWVKGSNRCDIGWVVDERTGRIVVVGVLDNLIKGAAGQAVQNMNIIMGCGEDCALPVAGGFPL